MSRSMSRRAFSFRSRRSSAAIAPSPVGANPSSAENLATPTADTVRIDAQALGRIGNGVPLFVDQFDRRNLELTRELPSCHGRSFGQVLSCLSARPPFVGKPNFQLSTLS